MCIIQTERQKMFDLDFDYIIKVYLNTWKDKQIKAKFI